MDGVAATIIHALKNPLKSDGQTPAYTLREQMALFDRAERWIDKRRRQLQESGDDGDTSGVDALRQLMADPTEVCDRMLADKAVVAELKSRGWIAPAGKRGPGRPRSAGFAEASSPDDEDDSFLRNQLGR